jgi:hypothetical protein
MTNLPPQVRKRTRSTISTSTPTAPAPCTPLQNDDRRIALSYVPIDAVTPPKRALKKHSQRGMAALRASLRTHGIIRPILVDADHAIVAGHGVWLAAGKLGFTEIPVVRVEHLTEAELSAYAIADNQIANTNPFSDDALREALRELNSLNLTGALDFSIEVTGFRRTPYPSLKKSPSPVQVTSGALAIIASSAVMRFRPKAMSPCLVTSAHRWSGATRPTMFQ